MDQPPSSMCDTMVGCCVGLCQGFTCVLDMAQILLREICFRRKAVLFYPKGFTQVALIGFFALCDSVNPCVRWEAMRKGLKHSGHTFKQCICSFVSHPASVKVPEFSRHTDAMAGHISPGFCRIGNPMKVIAIVRSSFLASFLTLYAKQARAVLPPKKTGRT